jgi:hypothetical protein
MDSDIHVHNARLTLSRTWPAHLEYLQVPRGNGRERSASQPPTSGQSPTPSGPPRRRLTSDFDERPSIIGL